MALRRSGGQLCKSISQASSHRLALPQIAIQRRYLATPVHPVTQDATGSKGPTAMVFLNMGGPSTTDEVGDFLSRLFVSYHQRVEVLGPVY
jgi:ferrochelatase